MGALTTYAGGVGGQRHGPAVLADLEHEAGLLGSASGRELGFEAANLD